MNTNVIYNLSATRFESPSGAAGVINLILDIPAPETAGAFIRDVAEKLKLQRLGSSSAANTLLITLAGHLSPRQFVAQWRELAARDGILSLIMSEMRVAQVTRQSEHGPKTVSLLEEIPADASAEEPAAKKPTLRPSHSKPGFARLVARPALA